MSNQIQTRTCVLTVIDLQAKLVPAACCNPLLMDRASMLIKGMRELNVPVICTEQYPQGLGSTMNVITELLQPDPEIVEKRSFSAFGCGGFLSSLGKQPAKTMVICGVETHVCVYQTAMDAMARGIDVIVASDAVSSRKTSDMETAIAMLRQAGATVLSSEAILFLCMGTSEHPSFKAVSKLVR
ncbi:MAG: isochorismatase family protein [Victivallaceae bacterium]|nr:isochorismatase family protein [Victivallaceae bacterium]